MRCTALFLLPLICLVLAACGGRGGNGHDYVGGIASVECAPFARALTGLRLSGAAADWWQQSDGRYARSHQPEVGSVLVLRRSARLPSGHVAVVSRVVSSRQIMVTQANWVHHRVTQDQPVTDVSSSGDWTEVRVWWPPTEQIGLTEYSAYGFIRPDHPAGHDHIIAATPAAIKTAAASW
jgi:surface antigen